MLHPEVLGFGNRLAGCPSPGAADAGFRRTGRYCGTAVSIFGLAKVSIFFVSHPFFSLIFFLPTFLPQILKGDTGGEGGDFIEDLGDFVDKLGDFPGIFAEDVLIIHIL